MGLIKIRHLRRVRCSGAECLRISGQASNRDCVSVLLAARRGSILVLELEGLPDIVRSGALTGVVGGVRAAGVAASVGDEEVRAATRGSTKQMNSIVI
jgi:hypothetical protein